MPYEERNTLMSNKFNELIELFIAEEQDKAKALFHDIVVEKSRDIYESLLNDEEQVNEYYVKSAKDVLNTLPAFAYRSSDPKDEEPEDKQYTAAVGDRADEMYKKLKAWLAAGNDFSPEEIEALDQAASGPEFIGLRGDADDQDVIDMLNSGLDTLEDIIGDKTESVEESVDNSDLERIIKLAGRSGVLGMNTNVIIAESVEVAEDEVSEEAFIAKEADDDEEEVDESFETVEEETVEEETVEVPVSALSELMRLAGYEEYKIDEYANEPEEEYSSAEDQMDLGGGLNGPKKAYAAAAGGDNPMDQEPTEIEEDNKLTFEGMYKRYMTQVVEETLEEKE